MILFVEFLGGLSSIPEEKLPGTSSTDVKAKERDPQLIPSDGSKKIFGRFQWKLYALNKHDVEIISETALIFFL